MPAEKALGSLHQEEFLLLSFSVKYSNGVLCGDYAKNILKDRESVEAPIDIKSWTKDQERDLEE